MDSAKDKRFAEYSVSCGPCITNGWPNHKQGRKCLLKLRDGAWLEDYYKQPHFVTSFSDLCELKETFEAQRNQRAREKLGASAESMPKMEPDDLVDWLVKRGICPHALVSTNSKYHFENSVLLDNEMGLNMPDPKLSIGETPHIYFQSIGIVRHERSKVKEEERESK